MLYTSTVEPNTFSVLKRLMLIPEIKPFSLVGGTALSLKFGHRRSIDLDFFCHEKFDVNTISTSLEKEFGNGFVCENQNVKWAVFCKINNVKVDIVHYSHPPIAPLEIIEDIRMYSNKDIVAMKINAILGRGAKKDFWDLAALFNEFTLAEIIEFHKQKFPSQMLLISIPSAITYFDDADVSEVPASLHGQTWKSVKKLLQLKVREFLS